MKFIMCHMLELPILSGLGLDIIKCNGSQMGSAPNGMFRLMIQQRKVLYRKRMARVTSGRKICCSAQQVVNKINVGKEIALSGPTKTVSAIFMPHISNLSSNYPWTGQLYRTEKKIIFILNSPTYSFFSQRPKTHFKLNINVNNSQFYGNIHWKLNYYQFNTT